MGANLTPLPLPSPPPPSTKSNLPMLYYGLIVVGTAAVALFVFNFIIVRWCTNRHGGSRLGHSGLQLEIATGQSFENASRSYMLSSFKYKKEKNNTLLFRNQGGEYECAVCLSVFEEGEELRQLPSCKHSFHAPCIDMWLYSHFNCPVCRAPVGTTAAVDAAENSRRGLLGSGFLIAAAV
ncbi:hypothetical protein SLEP1_g23207 [Rubroshorea leprosula]|uniref:RING-type domain-containing protein n=1 Tax=Rubroshorea leprosula TaxID=152421 RepID=A0AAV5JHT5_9ROSI|nr:hypothetical protein SLEP1_g23207 [Rubroshorea leprosula]